MTASTNRSSQSTIVPSFSRRRTASLSVFALPSTGIVRPHLLHLNRVHFIEVPGKLSSLDGLTICHECFVTTNVTTSRLQFSDAWPVCRNKPNTNGANSSVCVLFVASVQKIYWRLVLQKPVARGQRMQHGRNFTRVPGGHLSSAERARNFHFDLCRMTASNHMIIHGILHRLLPQVL